MIIVETCTAHECEECGGYNITETLPSGMYGEENPYCNDCDQQVEVTELEVELEYDDDDPVGTQRWLSKKVIRKHVHSFGSILPGNEYSA